MSTGTEREQPFNQFWEDEGRTDEGLARMRAKIGGLHCSLCTGTIEKALGRQDGVKKVAVSPARRRWRCARGSCCSPPMADVERWCAKSGARRWKRFASGEIRELCIAWLQTLVRLGSARWVS